MRAARQIPSRQSLKFRRASVRNERADQLSECSTCSPAQNTADGGWRDACLHGDLLARPPRPRSRSISSTTTCGVGRCSRCGRESDPAVPPILRGSINPLANRPRAGACGFGDGLRHLPARDLPCLKLQQLTNLSFLGQPTASSQLGPFVPRVVGPPARGARRVPGTPNPRRFCDRRHSTFLPDAP